MAKAKSAFPLDGMTSIVLLSDGSRLSRKDALAKGYQIFGEASSTEDGIPQKLAWKADILASSEANGRTAAVKEIWRTHTPETLSVEAARSFLRGLPIEEVATDPQPSPVADAKTQRLAEIRDSMAAVNRNNGYLTERRASVSASSIDPLKLERLTQIRLNALNVNQRNGSSTAAKELRDLNYAVLVREQTGKPLADVFRELNIDTSTIVRGHSN